MAKHSKRQRQAQLSFTPVPTFSPARASQPEAIRDRVAFVSIDSPSPNKQRHPAQTDLPTPRPSGPDSTSTLASSPLSKRPARSFMDGATSSPASSAARRIHGSTKRRKIVSFDDSESDEPVVQEDQLSLRAYAPLSKRTTRLSLSGASSSQAVAEANIAKQASAKHRDLDFFNDSESDEPVMLSSGTSKRKRAPARKPKDDFIVDDDENVYDDSEIDKQLRSSEVKTRNSGRTKKRKDDFVVADEEINERYQSPTLSVRTRKPQPVDPTLGPSDEEFVSSSSRAKQRAKLVSTDRPAESEVNTANQEDSEDEDGPIIRSRRRALRSSPPPASSQRSQRAQEDLDEDLEFLGVTDATTPRALRKGAGSTKKQGRRTMLEQLKERRLKQQRKASTAGTAGGDDDPFALSDHSGAQSEDDEDQIEEPYQPHEDNIEDFVLEDDENVEQAALPFEFSNYNTMKPKALFKFAVEWMVQKKINPAFSIEDEVYSIAFRRLDDYVGGMGNSKFQSSVWTVDFSKSVKRRPELVDYHTGFDGLRDRCDACNRSGHPATWEVHFKGKTYNRETLEEDSEDEEEEVYIDVPKAGTRYHIGKTCMANARMAHALAHWKFHLNDWVVDYLKEVGELTSDKIIARDSWSTSRRRKDAERIVDAMESCGEIRKLHKDFKTEIEQAQNVNNTQQSRDMSSV